MKALGLKHRLMILFSAMAFAAPAAEATMFAQSSKPAKSKTTITTTTTVSEDEVVPDTEPNNQNMPSTPKPGTIERESEMSATFGSKSATGMSGCKTEALSKNVIKELQSDCSAWMKDRKADLKDRFLTGTCNESCEDCGMGLKRCNVTGSVRYLLK